MQIILVKFLVNFSNETFIEPSTVNLRIHRQLEIPIFCQEIREEPSISERESIIRSRRENSITDLEQVDPSSISFPD